VQSIEFRADECAEVAEGFELRRHSNVDLGEERCLEIGQSALRLAADRGLCAPRRVHLQARRERVTRRLGNPEDLAPSMWLTGV
jgi:hypothetical protein